MITSETIPALTDTLQNMGNRDHLYKPGQSGNPAGRPKGARSKLSEAFIRVLCEDFTEHGMEVIERLRRESPAQYANVIGKLMPKLMELSGPDGSEIPIQGRVTFVRSGDTDKS